VTIVDSSAISRVVAAGLALAALACAGCAPASAAAHAGGDGGTAHAEPREDAEAPLDPDNRARPPTTSADLETRARHLFDALAANDPPLGDDFFFPRAPFLPLKDVQDPGRYHAQLLATYHRDIAALHGARKDWSDAAFVSFALGSEPRWVAPGREYNKIGYFRTFHGRLRYRTGSGTSLRTREIEVGTIISWDGRWYVTHLTPLHH
jgi:hypothetical protein